MPDTTPTRSGPAGSGRAERRAEVAGSAADIDTGQHGNCSSYRPPVANLPAISSPTGLAAGHAGYGTLPAMSTTSDLAVLSSITTQVDELSRRITALAESYGRTPDSAVASELFSTERAFATARRSLDRASTLLARLPD